LAVPCSLEGKQIWFRGAAARRNAEINFSDMTPDIGEGFNIVDGEAVWTTMKVVTVKERHHVAYGVLSEGIVRCSEYIGEEAGNYVPNNGPRSAVVLQGDAITNADGATVYDGSQVEAFLYHDSEHWMPYANDNDPQNLVGCSIAIMRVGDSDDMWEEAYVISCDKEGDDPDGARKVL
jgi:hypothetical protein